MNRQGADTGTQYRSTIMYVDEDQKLMAVAWKKKLGSKLADPVVTEIVPSPVFYPPRTIIKTTSDAIRTKVTVLCHSTQVEKTKVGR